MLQHRRSGACHAGCWSIRCEHKKCEKTNRVTQTEPRSHVQQSKYPGERNGGSTGRIGRAIRQQYSARKRTPGGSVDRHTRARLAWRGSMLYGRRTGSEDVRRGQSTRVSALPVEDKVQIYGLVLRRNLQTHTAEKANPAITPRTNRRNFLRKGKGSVWRVCTVMVRSLVCCRADAEDTRDVESRWSVLCCSECQDVISATLMPASLK